MQLKKPKFNVDWTGHRTVPEDEEGGLGLRLSAEVDNLIHELFTVVADNADETFWVEFYINDYAVRIPYDIVKKAIDIAPSRIFSFAEFERRQSEDQDK